MLKDVVVFLLSAVLFDVPLDVFLKVDRDVLLDVLLVVLGIVKLLYRQIFVLVIYHLSLSY